jgi:hypothetical protein
MRRTLVCVGVVGGLLVLGTLAAVVRAYQPVDPPPPPKEKGASIDELIDKVAAMKGKKEELEEQEEEALAVLKAKLARQKRRLAKVGLAEEAAPPCKVPLPPEAGESPRIGTLDRPGDAPVTSYYYYEPVGKGYRLVTVTVTRSVSRTYHEPVRGRTAPSRDPLLVVPEDRCPPTMVPAGVDESEKTGRFPPPPPAAPEH